MVSAKHVNLFNIKLMEPANVETSFGNHAYKLCKMWVDDVIVSENIRIVYTRGNARVSFLDLSTMGLKNNRLVELI